MSAQTEDGAEHSGDQTPDFEKLIRRELYSDIAATSGIDKVMRAEASLWHILFHQSREGIVILDEQGRVLDANPAFASMLGYCREEIHGFCVWDWDRDADQQEVLRLISELDSNGHFFDTTHKRKDGTQINVEVSTSCIYINAQKLAFCVCRDVSERKLYEQRMQLLVTTDELTGLLNRREFSRLLEMELSREDRYNTELAVIMFDIDHFKSINDRHGHQGGDRVLAHVSHLVSTSIRNVDCLCRWGGEEFILYLPETNQQQAVGVAEKLRIAIDASRPQGVNPVSASFGVTQCLPGDDLVQLINRVDQAMYEAKAAGRNCVKVS